MVRWRDRHLAARRIRRRDGILPKDSRRRGDNRRRARRTDPEGNFASAAAGTDTLAGGQSHSHRAVGRAGGAQRLASQTPASCFGATAVTQATADYTERRRSEWGLSILPRPFPT